MERKKGMKWHFAGKRYEYINTFLPLPLDDGGIIRRRFTKAQYWP